MIEIENKVTFNCCHPGCKESLIIKNKPTIAKAREIARGIGWRCPREKGQALICFCPKHWVWDVRHKATDLINAIKEEDEKEIIINGITYKTKNNKISYEDLIELKGYKPGTILTVAYAYPKSNQDSGILHPGKSVPLVDGIIFNMADTSNA